MSGMAETQLLIDLTGCDREPIHVPGHILPHGAMLVIDAVTLDVQEMVRGLDSCAALQALCQMAAERVRDVAQYDRVLVYRFMPDGSG